MKQLCIDFKPFTAFDAMFDDADIGSVYRAERWSCGNIIFDHLTWRLTCASCVGKKTTKLSSS